MEKSESGYRELFVTKSIHTYDGKEFLEIGLGCADSNGRRPDSTQYQLGLTKNKESEPTEKKINCIKDSFIYCINSAVITCLHIKDNFRLLQDLLLVPLPTGGKTVALIRLLKMCKNI